MNLTTYTVVIPAGTVTPQAIGGELDWGFAPVQDRRLTVQLAAAGDTLLVEGTLDGTNWWPLNATITGNTNANPVLISGPVKRIRATKSGTAGICTVVGVV